MIKYFVFPSPSAWLTKFLFFISLLTICISPSHSQQISSDTWIVWNLAVMQDLGYGWGINSSFKPYRMEDFLDRDLFQNVSRTNWLIEDLRGYKKKILDKQNNFDSDELYGVAWPGIIEHLPLGSDKPFETNAVSLYLKNQFWFKKHFSMEWYIRASSEPEALEHFTPVPRTPKRLGMNSGEYDQATISYYNSWLTLQLGRGRQIIGPGLKDNQLLSSNSPSYEHLLTQFRYKNFTGIFFTGFLESIFQDSINYNRYIVGHALQYSNRKNFTLSVTELTVYYGINRPFDLAYLNPLVPFFEVELNDRINDMSDNHSDSIYLLSFDWLLKHRFRISGTLLMDDFQIDQEDRDQGDGDAIGLQFRISKAFLWNKSAIINYWRYDRIGTFTFRHKTPYTAFFSRGLPLGTPDGSDFYAVRSGLIWISHFRTMFEVNYTYKKQGENNLLENEYEPYERLVKTNFPSGDVRTTNSLELRFIYSYRSNVDFELIYNLQDKRFLEVNSSSSYFLLRLNYHFPFVF